MSMYTRVALWRSATPSSAAWRPSPACRTRTRGPSPWSSLGRRHRGGDGRSARRAEDRDHPVHLPGAQPGPGQRRAGRDDRTPAGPFDDSLRTYALREAGQARGRRRLNTAISEVHADRVDFKDGSSLPADLVVWAAGVAGAPEIKKWGLPVGRGGRIEANDDTRVIGFENIFAVGDASLVTGEPLPQLAQPALQSGKHAARRSPGCTAAWTPRSSATTTRAPWPPSAAATPCSCRSG